MCVSINPARHIFLQHLAVFWPDTETWCDSNADDMIVLQRADATARPWQLHRLWSPSLRLQRSAAQKQERLRSLCWTQACLRKKQFSTGGLRKKKPTNHSPFQESFGVNHYANERARGPSEGVAEKEGLVLGSVCLSEGKRALGSCARVTMATDHPQTRGLSTL